MGPDQREPGADPPPEEPAQAEPSSESGDDERSSPDEAPDEAPDEPPLTPAGNTPRPRKWALAVGALVPLFVLMSTDIHFTLSVPLGVLCCVIAAWAMLDALGTFDDALPADLPQPDKKLLVPRVVELAGSTIALLAALRLAVAGVLPKPLFTAGFLAAAGTLWVVISGYRVLEVLGFTSGPGKPKLLERPGFWLFVAQVALYLVLLGSFSLSDPWETHYGEVAREMLARDDWISLWWAQDGWFWSKPVLDFWLQGLCFSLLGVRFMPDEMLSAASAGHFPQPEWAARLPVFVLTCIASWVLYRAVGKAFGRRAGLVGALVLTTMPYWFLLAHQSMTDMPYVAPLATALGLLLLGLQTDPEEKARVLPLTLGSRRYGLSVYHLLFGLILVSVVPQILYLFSRHLSLQLTAEPYGFRWHLDEFFSGSGGNNCGLPGNEGCRPGVPVDHVFQPGLTAVFWCAALGLLLYANRGERRVQRLYFIAAWYFTALSALAKGAPGLILPVVIACVAIGAALRFKDFARLELPALALLIACVALPWYVQMYVRHGPPFTDRLLIHDMYKRAFSHVHDTNAGDDTSFRYYVWQLGYGLFPWTGLAAGGLLMFQRHGDEARSHKATALGLLVLWFAVVFGMFSITKTKFHHYLLPGVPPLAMLAGIALDRALAGFELGRAKLASYLGCVAGAALFLLYGIARLFPGSVLGSVGVAPHGALDFVTAGVALVAGCVLLVFAVRTYGSGAPPDDDDDRFTVAVLGATSALAVLLAGRDLFSTVELSGSARLFHLVTYNYKRAWPSSLDFSLPLKAFTLVAALACAALAVQRFQRHAAVLTLAVGVWFAVWGLDVYLFRIAPHYGQRETILEYYRKRKGPEEPFVAYQMNWKGENFYTGNRVPAFVQSGAKFKSWISEQKSRGVRVMFFSTEHTRINSLKSELGSVKKFELLTTPELNNKFFLARVEL